MTDVGILRERDAADGVIRPVEVSYGYASIARALHISKRTLMRHLAAGRLPPPLRLGAATRFSRQWLADVLTKGVQAAGTYTPTIGTRGQEQQSRSAMDRAIAAQVEEAKQKKEAARTQTKGNERRSTTKKNDVKRSGKGSKVQTRANKAAPKKGRAKK